MNMATISQFAHQLFGSENRRQHTHGHVERRDREHISSRMLRLELAGWRTRGKADSRFMDVVKEEMELVKTRG